MQTRRQIQQLLASAGIRPNKRLGQNFLIDRNLLNKLIDSAGISSEDIVLEIGCGTGSLTEDLAQKAGSVIAVEFDRTLAEIAGRQTAKYTNVEVINTDILERKNAVSQPVVEALRLASQKHTGRYLLISNLPYSVASAVILNLVTGPIVFDAMYVTVQKEVAQRMAAGPGGKDYGSLSIFLGAAGDVKIERILKPSVFWPQPKVESAQVSFIYNQTKVGRIKNMPMFGKVINLFMSHRRKMLKSCVKFAAGELAEVKNWLEIFERNSINPTNRPEQIPPQGYVNIANLCYEQLNNR